MSDTTDAADTTVMFADISGSSRLYKELGDDAANARIVQILDAMLVETGAHGGELIKTLGDEIMVCFASANAACHAAIAIQRAPQIDMPIRIGMATGTVIKQAGDVFGEAVNDAAAVARIANGKQILVAERTAAQLDHSFQGEVQRFDDIRLKGSTTETPLFRVCWAATASATASHTVIMPVSTRSGTQLALYHGTQQFVITPELTPFSMGRGTHCSLPIASGSASREHCDITWQRGKFILVDRSTNGTWVRSEHGEIYLRREELPLVGTGVISLGQTSADAGELSIYFQC